MYAMTPTLSSRELIETWEAGRNLQPLEQALALLAAAGCAGDLTTISLAERDRTVLQLREATFGPSLNMIADCPGCGSLVEINLDTSDLAEAIIEPAPEQLECATTSVTVRSLSTGDLMAASHVSEDQRGAIVRQRLVHPSIDGLNETDVSLLDELVERRERETEIRLALECNECGHSWVEPFDPVVSVWEDIERAALSALADVADLAAAFGWSEGDILAMSDRRRASYLALCRGV